MEGGRRYANSAEICCSGGRVRVHARLPFSGTIPRVLFLYESDNFERQDFGFRKPPATVVSPPLQYEPIRMTCFHNGDEWLRSAQGNFINRAKVCLPESGQLSFEDGKTCFHKR